MDMIESRKDFPAIIYHQWCVDKVYEHDIEYRLRAESAALCSLLSSVLAEQRHGDPDRLISDTLESEIESALRAQAERERWEASQNARAGRQAMSRDAREGLEMKTRPILFNSEMVRAILEGRKVQTRRVIPPAKTSQDAKYFDPSLSNWPVLQGQGSKKLMNCPYGQPGDRLWVRETWRQAGGGGNLDGSNEYVVIEYRASFIAKIMRDDLLTEYAKKRKFPTIIDHSKNGVKWCPSIHMPRWASRLTLEVTGVRVERVQDISHQDALAEGWPRHLDLFPTMNSEGKSLAWFRCLWDSIAKKGLAFSENPWVWVVEFQPLLDDDNH